MCAVLIQAILQIDKNSLSCPHLDISIETLLIIMMLNSDKQHFKNEL